MEGEVVIAVLGVVLVGLIVWRRSILLKPSANKIVEPISFLYRDFSLARVIGEEEKTISMLMSFARATSGEPTILDEVIEGIITLPRRPAKPVNLLMERPLNVFGRQRIFRQDKRVFSVVVGGLEELKELINIPENWRQEARRASGRGYLPLVVAIFEPSGEIRRAFQTQHQPLGLLLVEGVLENGRLKALENWGQGSVRFLTFAPKELAEWLYARIFPEADPLILTPAQLGEIRPLRKRDDQIKNATIFASAGLEERYHAINIWKHQGRVELYSRNPEDDELPAEPYATLP